MALEYPIYMDLFRAAILMTVLPLALYGSRRGRLLMEVGALFAVLLWAAVAFHSFDVVKTTSCCVQSYSYESMAALAAGGGGIMLAFTYKVMFGTIPDSQGARTERTL